MSNKNKYKLEFIINDSCGYTIILYETCANFLFSLFIIWTENNIHSMLSV